MHVRVGKENRGGREGGSVPRGARVGGIVTRLKVVPVVNGGTLMRFHVRLTDFNYDVAATGVRARAPASAPVCVCYLETY